MHRYILIFWVISSVAFAQQKYQTVNQLWGGYYNSIKLNSKVSINTDIQGRTTDWYKQWSQLIARTGISFRPNEKISFSGGFADFLFFQKENKASRNEYRPWIEFGMNDKCADLKITHRFRAEDRNFQSIRNDELINKYSSNYRFRYRIDFQYPLWKKAESERSLNFQVGNEIFINAGKSIVNNYFDQNRTWTGFLFTVNKNLGVQLQYLSIYQQLSNGTVDKINVFRFNIYHTIVL